VSFFNNDLETLTLFPSSDIPWRDTYGAEM